MIFHQWPPSSIAEETQLRLGAENGHIREISVEPTAHWEAKEARNAFEQCHGRCGQKPENVMEIP